MKITDRLLGDHNTFRKILSELDAFVAAPVNGAIDRRMVRLVELLVDHMVIHGWAEHTYYYPVVKKATVKNKTVIKKDDLDRLEKDHNSIDKRLLQLEKEVKASPPSLGWSKTYHSIHRQITNHMRQEEEKLFPSSEVLLGEQRLEQLSLELERDRSKAPKIRSHLQT